jgi:hypothetical protein
MAGFLQLILSICKGDEVKTGGNTFSGHRIAAMNAGFITLPTHVTSFWGK